MRHIAGILGITGLVVILSSPGLRSQTGKPVKAAAPVFKVDPFWPKWLPNRWSMQQVTGIGIDPQNDHIWFINRAAAANPDEIGGDQNKIDCCIRGPEIIELDQEGTVVRAWGGPGTSRNGRPRCRP